MNVAAFDQDLSGGWRPLAQKGCKGEAADLIAEYRARMLKASDSPEAVRRDGRFLMLGWHEGQMWAMVGETDKAIPLFEQARGSDTFGASADWLVYVDATIAFLHGDRKGLEAARAKELGLPKPDGWQQAMEKQKAAGLPVATWPPNLAVIDGLLKCFGKPYSEAYGGKCESAPAQ